MRYFCCGPICFVFWSRIFVLFEPYARVHSNTLLIKLRKWVAAYWEIAAHSAKDMFSKY